MGAHQIQALVMGAVVLLVGWHLIQVLRRGEVTTTGAGGTVKRADNPRGYWTWTGILAVLEIVAITILIGALRAR
jgi:hypothetical protein